MERDGPRRGGDEHDQADGNREGARGDAKIDGGAGQITADGHHEHADAEIGAEDAAAEAVFGIDLEERAGEDPVDGASGVRGNDGADGDGERSGGAEKDVAGGGDHEADQNADAQAGGAFARPAAADQGTEEGACAAGAHQHAHAEEGGAAVVQAGEFHRENALAEDGEQHVVGAEQTDATFDEDGGEEAGLAADVADAFEDGGELHQFAGAQGGVRGGVGFGETHAADQPGGEEKREGVDHEDGVASHPDGGDTAQRRAGGEAERPRDGGQRVGGEHLIFGDDVGDDGTVRGLEEGGADGLDEEQRVDQPDHGWSADQQHAEDDEEAHQIGADHDALAADAVIEHAGGGGGEGAGENLQDDGEGDGLGLAAGEIEQEIVDGEGVEQVADFADDLGEPEETVVAVLAEEGEVGGEHGKMDRQGCLSYV